MGAGVQFLTTLEMRLEQHQSDCKLHPLLQGHLTDLSFRAKDGRTVECHKIVAAGLSPFMTRVLAGSPESDQVILPDFGLAAIYGLMNFNYTGR